MFCEISGVLLVGLYSLCAYAQESHIVSALSSTSVDLREAGETLLPEFRSGMLLLRHRGAGGNGPHYSVYSREGKLIARFRLDLPGADRTLAGAFAPADDGYVAIGIAIRGAERVASLCFLDRRGKLLKVVKTSPAGLVSLSVAPDRTVWGLGGIGPEDRPESEDPVLFQFSMEGKLLGTALPRRLFGQESPLEPEPGKGNPALASAANRVVVYAPGNYQLFELGLDRKLLASYTIRPPNRYRDGQPAADLMTVSAVTVTNQGAVYGLLRGGDRSGIYELDRLQKRWVALPPDLLERFGAVSLIGSDGNQLALVPAGPRGTNLPVTLVTLTPRFAAQP
jgi:hypothetical protein